MTAHNYPIIKPLIFLSAVLLAFFVLAGQVEAAALQLSPPGGTYTVNQAFNVNINLSLSSETIDGVDAILNFNRSILEVTGITTGSLFVDYPTSTYDNDTGKITVAGLASSTNPLTSGGTVATITFKAKAAGTGTVTFDFTSGSGTDSNVAEHTTGNDILESVVNGSYTVNANGTTTTGTGGTTDTTTGLPTTGNQPLTTLLFLTGVGLLGLGWTFRFFRS